MLSVGVAVATGAQAQQPHSLGVLLQPRVEAEVARERVCQDGAPVGGGPREVGAHLADTGRHGQRASQRAVRLREGHAGSPARLRRQNRARLVRLGRRDRQ